jgi:hypothetical protein
VSDEVVLVATARLDPDLRRLVTEACDHARVRPVFWNATGPESALAAGGGLAPFLLLAALPAGVRTIPDDVAAIVTQAFPALPLLLLCAEPLIRHSISLHGGQVTLLGQPHTREKISARMRTAVVGRAVGADSDRSGTQDGEGVVRVREMRGREWWAGVVARDSEPGHRPPDAGDLLPSVCTLGRHGIAGLIPLNPKNPVAPSALQQAALGLASAAPSERAAAELEAALGAEAAAAWFSPAAFQWSFYVPKPETEFWLYSPMRLPNAFKVVGAAGSWRTLGAASGDVVVVLASDPGDGNGHFPDDDFWRVAEGGGPAVLDYMQSRLAARPGAGAALIVELR